MSVKIVKSVVSTFLSDAEPGVLVIKGAWGVGKTHAWNDILFANRDALKIPQYAYISLFGQKSISELKTALVAKTRPSKYIGESYDWGTVNREWLGLIKPTVKTIAVWASQIKPSIPYIKEVSLSFDSIAGFLLKDSIICLDDWERTKIPPEDLLGFISELKIELKCKVALIFNDGKLSEDQERAFTEYREKVIDIELAFTPTSEEAVDIAIIPGCAHAHLLRDRITRLDIRNIRLIGKILTLVKLLDEHIKSIRTPIQEQVISTAVLMTWVHYAEKSPRKPSVEFIRRWNNLGAALRANRENDATSTDEQIWASVLNDYGYMSTDELDLAVDQVIQRGYWQGTSLVTQLEVQETKLAAAELEQSFEQAWQLFHGSFADNEREVIDSLSNGLRRSVKFVSPMNLNGTVSVLRQLKQDALADELIELYINSRSDEEDLFDLEKNPFGGDVTDEQIRKRFNEVNIAQMVKPSLFDAVTGARKTRGWSREDGQVMDDATVDDIYHLIMMNNGGNQGHEFLTACAWLSSVNGRQEFRRKFMEALTRVASTSPLNAARVRRFGVLPSKKEA